MIGFHRFAATAIFLLCFAPSASGTTIDIMIVYDSTAKSWVDRNGGMNVFAADAVARMNQVAANSNVNLTFRLVHAAEVSYTYSGDVDFGTDMDKLQSGAGNLSVVHEWRNTYYADLVAMMVDTGSAYGTVGRGNILQSYSGNPDSAYTVNAIRAVDVSQTLTHEVGHNLGCGHSKYQVDSPGPNTYLNTYSAGWYFTGTNSKPYHTIMAYNSDGYGNTYTEAPLFSTPLLTYQNTPAGHTADGDNARNIRETMGIVAAYRSTPAPIDGTCGSANGGSFWTAPATNLCSTGTATSLSGTGPWTWSCTGLYGGSMAHCSANIRTMVSLPWLQLLLTQPVNGTCGSANGGIFGTAPTTNLCSTGTVSGFSVRLPTGWSWSCTGSDGGSNANCFAYWFWW